MSKVVFRKVGELGEVRFQSCTFNLLQKCLAKAFGSVTVYATRQNIFITIAKQLTKTPPFLIMALILLKRVLKQLKIQQHRPTKL